MARDAYGAPQIVCNARAQALLDRHRIRAVTVSLTHDRTSASAVALAIPAQTDVPLPGKVLYRFLPMRRTVILENLRRVFGEAVPETNRAPRAGALRASVAPARREAVAMESVAPAVPFDVAAVRADFPALAQTVHGRPLVLISGHFGNFEVATVAGLTHFPQMRDRIHFVRRAIKPRWLDALVNRRFRAAGFGVMSKRGSLDTILDRLAAGDMIVFPFDQHASPPDGIESEFFGHPAWTFKSLAIIALATGAPVLPAAGWREPDRKHVLRVEEPVPLIETDNVNEEIRANTRAFNAALEHLVLRHPEQWFWVHRRWKAVRPRRSARSAPNGI